MPRSRLLYYVDQMSKSDLNRDGRVSDTEFESMLKERGKVFMGGAYSGGGLRILAYTPVYTCRPPTIFLLLVTIAQIAIFATRYYCKNCKVKLVDWIRGQASEVRLWVQFPLRPGSSHLLPVKLALQALT